MNCKYLTSTYYKFNKKTYKKKIQYDYDFNKAFRGSLSKEFLRGYEWKYIKCYRKYQSNIGNIWGRFYRKKYIKTKLFTEI